MRYLKHVVVMASLAAAVTSVFAQARPYPGDKPITIVVPFVAGGPTDRVARDLAEAMRKPLGGATLVIENVTGAGGSIGAAKVARAQPDGHTIMLHHISMATMPGLVRNMPFNVENDFEYLGMINDVPMTVVARPSLEANNFKDLVTWINQYKGTAPAMTDLMGGQIDLMCDQTTNTSQQIEGKKIKAFAVTTPKRLTTAALKDLPTLDEVGYKGLQVTIFHGLYAPKGTPADIQKRLNDALKAALKDPEFIKKQEGLGAVVVTDNRVQPADHKKFVSAEIAKWTPIIKAAGVYAD